MDKVTAKVAAEMLGITEYSVYRLIKDGKIKAEKFGHVCMVDRDSVEDFAERNEGKDPHDPTR